MKNSSGNQALTAHPHAEPMVLFGHVVALGRFPLKNAAGC
jgi:hypothetical protein